MGRAVDEKEGKVMKTMSKLTTTIFGIGVLGAALLTSTHAKAACNDWEYKGWSNIHPNNSDVYTETCNTNNIIGYSSSLSWETLYYPTEGGISVQSYGWGATNGANYGYYDGTDVLCTDGTVQYGPANGPYYSANALHQWFGCSGHGNGNTAYAWGAGYLCTGLAGAC
jgi:hypothetical protein